MDVTETGRQFVNWLIRLLYIRLLTSVDMEEIK